MPPDPLQALLGAGVVPTVSFPPTSRYAIAKRQLSKREIRAFDKPSKNHA